MCRLQNAKVYVFGSILRSQTHIEDVDLLVIYDNDNQLRAIKSRLHRLELLIPLDVIAMTYREERELDFIRSEGCIEVDVWARQLTLCKATN